MGQLLEQVCSPTVQNAAWKYLRNDRAVWLPGISRADMEKDIVYHLTTLVQELALGTYRPSPVRLFPMAKADGGRRVISALTLRDKLAQRAVLTVLKPLGEAIFHADSYGYRPGRSVEMAVSKAREHIICGLDWLVDADIKSFFDQIPHRSLYKALKPIIPDRDILQLLELWLDVGVPRTGILSRRRGVSQGGIISPFLCNVYLTSFDRYLAAGNLPFVRFADDFLVFTPDCKSADVALKYVEKGLKKLDLALNMEKTRVVRSGPNVRFLGRKLPKRPASGLPAVPGGSRG